MQKELKELLYLQHSVELCYRTLISGSLAP
jgi:hypothetical protein